MKKKFVNAFDFSHTNHKGEVNNEPSKTQPNMTMSLQEILARYTRGGEVATFQPVYQNHDDFDENPDISKMDTLERKEYARELRESIKDYQNRQKPSPKTEEKQPETKPKPEPAKDSEKPTEGGSSNSS